jgi:hypothetical protein
LRREYVLVEVTADADGDRPVVTGHLDRLPRDGQPLRRSGITASGIHVLNHRRSHSGAVEFLATRSARSCDVSDDIGCDGVTPTDTLIPDRR